MTKPAMKYFVKYILAPVLFLTVALTAGIRFQTETGAFQFVYPPLVSCIVGALAMVLLVRCGVVWTPEADGEDQGLLESASRLVLMTAVYVATVQVFSSVTPERGLLSLFFNLFYLLILLNDLFVVFNPRRLAGALAALLGASFLLKYLFLADLFAPASSWGKYVLQELMKAGSLGVLDQGTFAPATGYLAFFTVVCYVLGLYSIAPRATRSDALLYKIMAHRYAFTPAERIRLLSAFASFEDTPVPIDAQISDEAALARSAEIAPRQWPSPSTD